MSKFITTEVRPKLPIPACRQVQIKAFNTSTLKWKKLSLDWLRQMEAEKFECTQGHTLNITGGAQIQFVIFVCELVTSLTSTLPPKIYFHHFEVPFKYGHAIMADCDSFPASIRILRYFWRCGDENGVDIPHFEDLVLPLAHKLISRFGKEGAWAGLGS